MARLGILVRICALLTAGIGLVALLGWALGVPVLASPGSGMVPVAPSTAVMFMLCAAALLLSFRVADRGTYRTVWAINLLVAIVALLLFILSVQGIHLQAEHLGITIADTQAGPPTGHMSPVTAFCFLLAAMSFMALLVYPKRPRMAAPALWLACLLIALGFLLVLAYLYGTPFFYNGSFIPPAALTSLAFMLLGTALLALAAPQVRLFHPQTEATARTSSLFILIFILLAAGIVTAGYLSFRGYEKRYRAGVERQLSSIAELKVGELVQWRKERLADALIFFRNPAFSSIAARYLRKPEDAKAREQLLTWLIKVREHYQYDRVFMLDAGGGLRISLPDTSVHISPATVRSALEVLRAGRVAFQDFYRSETSRNIHLALLVPLAGEQAGSRPIGVLVLRIDPEKYLYPFIRRWPTPSSSAETLLVRRDGNDALFLNEVRFMKGSALSLRVPLKKKEVPAVQAVLGHKGTMQGIDYRGVEVIADVRPVPGSPWSLVARMDASEVYAPVRERLWIMVGFVVVLLLAAGAGLGLVWRQQSVRFYRQQCETTEEIKQKNTELERFTYTISHDLKSPLVTVKTFLGYLEQDMLSQDRERVGQDIGYIRTAADKMGQLLDELLEMSRIGRMVNPPVNVSFRELVEEALNAVAGRTAERGVDVQVEDKDLSLHGDRPRLAEIWQNLIENAVKFMGDQEKPLIEIGTETQGTDTVFFVRDNGMGIDTRYNAKVFGLFEKLDPKSEGTGLGLALVKRIVELYRGTIRLESEGPGQGTCVRFTLPEAVNKRSKGEKS